MGRGHPARREGHAGVEPQRAVWLDLRRGTCHGTRTAADASAADAPFEIAAAYPAWTEVLAGRLGLVVGTTLGNLKRTGNVAQIASHAKAAEDSVACAASVTTAPAQPRRLADPTGRRGTT